MLERENVFYKLNSFVHCQLTGELSLGRKASVFTTFVGDSGPGDGGVCDESRVEPAS